MQLRALALEVPMLYLALHCSLRAKTFNSLLTFNLCDISSLLRSYSYIDLWKSNLTQIITFLLRNFKLGSFISFIGPLNPSIILTNESRNHYIIFVYLPRYMVWGSKK